MKDVKKLLTEQANKVLPDERLKESIKGRLGYTETEQQYALAHGGTAEKRNKKIWISLIAAALALLLCLGILLPVLLSRDPSNPGSGLSGNKFLQIENAEDFYIYGAASVGSLLAATQEESASAFGAEANTTSGRTAKILRAQPSAAHTAATFETLTAAQNSGLSGEEAAVAETVNGYMALIENLLGEGNIAHDTASTPADDTYAGQYAFKSVITYHDLLGGSVSYILYYNTELTGSETEDGETEETYAINGLLAVGDETYAVRGEHEKEEESEPGESESESELTFTAYRTVGGRSIPYIRMRQELSSEQEGSETEKEQKFVYTYYDENGRIVQSTTAEYEEEDGDLEVLLTVQKGEETDKLLFRNTGSGSKLRVTASIGGQQYSFAVQILTDANGNAYYSYEFSDHHGNYDRFDDDDEEDDDEDDDD